MKKPAVGREPGAIMEGKMEWLPRIEGSRVGSESSTSKDKVLSEKKNRGPRVNSATTAVFLLFFLFSLVSLLSSSMYKYCKMSTTSE